MRAIVVTMHQGGDQRANDVNGCEGMSRDLVGLVERLSDDIDDSFRIAPQDTIASVRDHYLAACEHSRVITHGRSLDEEYQWREVRVSLRYVLAHMVQELARHAGHGDILVEQLRAQRRT